jgi:co-chaperonin GroES (HSP10)
MKPYAPVNRVFVTADKIWDDEIEFESGVKLYKDTTYEPEWHVHIHGNVATLPLEFRKDMMNRGIDCEVDLGDKVYFHYFTLREDENRVTVDGVDYYMVEYHNIFCRVIDGLVLPTHGWCFVSIPEEKEEEATDMGIIIPDMLRKRNVDTYGELKYKPSRIGINANPGDTVYFDKTYAFKNKIEGVEYYVIHESNLAAYKPSTENNYETV